MLDILKFCVAFVIVICLLWAIWAVGLAVINVLVPLLSPLASIDSFPATLLVGLIGLGITLLGALTIGAYFVLMFGGQPLTWDISWNAWTVIAGIYALVTLIFSPLYLFHHPKYLLTVVALDTALDVALLCLLVGLVKAVGMWRDGRTGVGCFMLVGFPVLITGVYLCTVVVPTFSIVCSFGGASSLLCR